MKHVSLLWTTLFLVSACGSLPISETLSSELSTSSTGLYRVTFDSRGGHSVNEQMVEPLSFLVEPVVSREGHTFLGWFQSNNEGVTLTNPWNFLTDRVESDLILYADWDINSYTLQFNAQGGTSINSFVLDYGTTIEFPQPVKEGFIFIGWYLESSVSDRYPSLTVMPAEDLTLYAQWRSKEILPESEMLVGGFGDVVDLDGDYMLLGSPYADINGKEDQGSVTLFKLSDENFQRTLTPSNGQAYDYFGSSLAIDGDYIVIGSPSHDVRGSDSGAAYVYKISDPSYERIVLPLDLLEGDTFGWGISLDDGMFVVSSNLSDDSARDAGSFYLFSCEDLSFEEKIIPTLGQADDWFGWGTAIDNGLVAVGSILDDNQGNDSGSVFLYDFSTQTHLATLTTPNVSPNAYFGNSITITNQHIIVGAPGSASTSYETAGLVYIFDRETKQLIHTLHSPAPANGNSFGHSVASDGTYLMVSEHSTNRDNMENVGTAWCFDIATWSLVEKIDSPVEAPHENFSFSWDGRSIAIDAGMAVMGSSANDQLGNDAGKAYLYSFASRTFITLH
ncbi:MAG: hypothetical protein RLZZ264_378 [Bacillota bacterium]|jgi:uncharacterized repeat protein (TIGR02543 family)